MGSVEISDGVGTRRIRVDDLEGVVRVDCSGDDPVVVVPEGAQVDQESGGADDPGVNWRLKR